MKFPTDQPGIQSIIDYLGHQPMRPKEEIAREMALLGFRIPILFDGFKDAKGSGEDFIARSEGPDELYHSGIKASLDTRHGPHVVDRIRSLDGLLNDPDRTYQSLTADKDMAAVGMRNAGFWYSMAQKLDGNGMSNRYDDEFAQSHSLSYWQTIAGDNYYVIGDTVLPRRYYIGRINKGRRSFTVVDGDSVKHDNAEWVSGVGEEVPDTTKLIEFYEAVRNAPLFDA